MKVPPVFVDTSALYALLVADDAGHARAAQVFRSLQDREAPLVTTSYVLVESYALFQRRVGGEAVAAFRERFAPLLDVVWVGRTLHERGLDLLLDGEAGSVSLVDAVSFEVMRDRRIEDAFVFDRDFEDAGFRPLT